MAIRNIFAQVFDSGNVFFFANEDTPLNESRPESASHLGLFVAAESMAANSDVFLLVHNKA